MTTPRPGEGLRLDSDCANSCSMPRKKSGHSDGDDMIAIMPTAMQSLCLQQSPQRCSRFACNSPHSDAVAILAAGRHTQPWRDVSFRVSAKSRWTRCRMHSLLCCQGSDAFASVWARVVSEYRAHKVAIQCGRYHPLQAGGCSVAKTWRPLCKCGYFFAVRTYRCVLLFCARASRSFLCFFSWRPPFGNPPKNNVKLAQLAKLLMECL